MDKIKLNEVQISEAIQRYLEDKGYIVRNLQMVHDGRTNEFSAIAAVEKY